MAKIKVRSGRGTRIVEVDDSANKWTGSDFKKSQEARKEASKDKYVSVGRGTGTIKFGDIPTTTTQSTKGMWVSSGRGTGKRKL
ncbi:MAG: hypothetical protein K5798_10205 [Nitrosopumilus sp.]|uniref:Uncharacterized protein n=1 Tax=Nitrosopumilus zosterae TaxID=718286 RepID=A0A2S2KQU7_9ARCH|nr:MULTISPECIES: hypothetical protein [Nitrosopumilus]MCV0367616.1 hypothetical protein [Nitrosopumilus sp.]BDQ30537.1 hypothetical protein NZOSNM25_000641 [Nitrosopumilus zosterae]GBH34029.1 hypothetical protein NZNM25_08200 [Nitrosopumilus zosterae]